MELYNYKAFVTAVYDGDTITVDIDLGMDVWFKGQKIRLYGIDAPEVRGKERASGLISRDWLRDKILGKEILLKTIKDEKGKYGRWLANVFVEEDSEYVNVNTLLVTNGYAVEKYY
jgi:micrococcal nuclease